MEPEMKQTFREAQGHSVWYPVAFALLMLGFVASIIMAIYSQDWRWFIATLVCFGIIAFPFRRA
jgi:hypothetical protein